jgi:hypothetical protein
MKLLCKATNEVWNDNIGVFQRYLRLEIKPILESSMFDEAQRDFLLESDRYKYYRIDSSYPLQSESVMSRFIKTVQHPEELDLINSKNKQLCPVITRLIKTSGISSEDLTHQSFSNIEFITCDKIKHCRK